MLEVTVPTLFIAGLLGSTHCLAMCGGIATALGSARGRSQRGSAPLLYQLGRISSYGIAGSLAGAAGAAGMSLATSRWSDVLRIATALIVVVIGLKIALGARARARWMSAPERLGGALWRRLLPHAKTHLPESPALRALTLGMLWGWLPCGLVYSALLAAAVAGGAAAGAASMLAFGAGTLPAMLGASVFGNRLPRPDGSAARILGAVIVACGLWTATVPIATLTGLHRHQHHMMTMPQPGSAAADHAAMHMTAP
jgi:sulfite exporter TauE/SafE